MLPSLFSFMLKESFTLRDSIEGSSQFDLVPEFDQDFDLIPEFDQELDVVSEFNQEFNQVPEDQEFGQVPQNPTSAVPSYCCYLCTLHHLGAVLSLPRPSAAESPLDYSCSRDSPALLLPSDSRIRFRNPTPQRTDSSFRHVSQSLSEIHY